MGDSVVDNGQDAGIGNQHLVHAGRRGVAMVGRKHVVIQLPSQCWQLCQQLADLAAGLLPESDQILLAPVKVLEFQRHLIDQFPFHIAQHVGHELVFPLFGQIRWAQAHGKQYSAESIYRLMNGLMRGQLTAAQVQLPSLAFAPVMACQAQFARNFIDKTLTGWQRLSPQMAWLSLSTSSRSLRTRVRAGSRRSRGRAVATWLTCNRRPGLLPRTRTRSLR